MIGIPCDCYCNIGISGYFVYFISNNAGAVKIGMTNNISRRFQYLQNGNSNDLGILAVMKYKDKSSCAEMENYLHRMFANSCIRGEWFKENDVIDFIKKVIHPNYFDTELI